MNLKDHQQYFITKAMHLSGMRYFLVFANGDKGEVNLSDLLDTSPYYDKLKSKKVAQHLKVEFNTLVYDEDFDICPEVLFKLMKDQRL